MRYSTALLLLFLLIGNLSNIQAQTAKEIIKKSEDKLRGNSSKSAMKITTIRPKWNREMTMTSWSLGTKKSLIVITGPAREKGNSFLKNDKEVWNWVPGIERTIKLPPSMMSQSWMGTDLTNDDLVKETERDNDFNQKIIGTETIDGRLCWKIEMIPTEDANVVWGKIISWIDQKDYLNLKTEFYDEDNYLVSTMNASKIKMLGGQLLPSIMEIIPADKEGHRTRLEYIFLNFNVELTDQFFTLQNMRKISAITKPASSDG